MDMTGTGKAAGPRAAPVGNAALPASGPRFADVTVRRRGRWLRSGEEGVTCFVPFRTVDWLRKSVVDAIEPEGNAVLDTVKQVAGDRSGEERKNLQRLSRNTIERYRDDGAGACYLVNPALADEIAGTRKPWNHQRHSVFAGCLMPDPVLLADLLPGQPLASVIDSFQSFSAEPWNRVLAISGPSWQREYSDHLAGDVSEFERPVRYLGENPAKAGRRDWRWVWGQDGPAPAGGTPVPLPRAGTTES